MSEAHAPILNCGAPPVIVPVVTPGSRDQSISGRVRNVEVRALDTSGWLEPLDDGSGGWALRKSMEKQGYMLLEDAYAAENNPEGWAMFQRYLRDWRTARTTLSFPLQLLPELVQARQRGEIGADKVDPWLLPPPKPTTGATTRPEKARG